VPVPLPLPLLALPPPLSLPPQEANTLASSTAAPMTGILRFMVVVL
jgi:hypothetical protein